MTSQKYIRTSMWTKEKTIVVIIVVALIVIVVAFFLATPQNNGSSGSSTVGSRAVTPPGELQSTWEPVPANISVPNEGDVNVAQGVAIPDVEVAAHVIGPASYRQFALSMDDGIFTPSTVIVRKDDIVDLEITAMGQNYQFTQPDYGFNEPLTSGTTQKIQFQAVNPGKFTFYCAACGGPLAGPIGFLIVTQN